MLQGKDLVSDILQVIFQFKDHMDQRHRGQGQMWSRSPGQKCGFRYHLTILQVMFEIKDHESGSKVMAVKVKGHWVKCIKPSVKVMILAGWLISMSICFTFSRVSGRGYEIGPVCPSEIGT